MRRFFIVLFILVFPAPAIFAAEAEGTLRPVDLRCEYRTNPLGVDTPAPRLSWKLEATNPTARGTEPVRLPSSGGEQRSAFDAQSRRPLGQWQSEL